MLASGLLCPVCSQNGVAVSAPPEVGSTGTTNMPNGSLHLTPNDTVLDVVNHPSFSGFGRFILPLERGSYRDDMPLNRVASLLPYHSHVHAERVLSTINRIVDEAATGQVLFYDIYSQPQKQNDSTKNNTGLFLIRGKPGAPFAVICAGGGFSYVASIHEGFPYAFEISEKGYNAFVLQYRVGGERVACEDLAAALSYIFSNAKALEVGVDNYSIWGSSAGARMAARLGSVGAVAYGGNRLPKPCVVVMAYTGYSNVSQNDPPTFITSSEDDPIASVSTIQRRADALKNAGVDVVYRKYKKSGHGFGLGIGSDAEGWIDHAIQFWTMHMPQ